MPLEPKWPGARKRELHDYGNYRPPFNYYFVYMQNRHLKNSVINAFSHGEKNGGNETKAILVLNA